MEKIEKDKVLSAVVRTFFKYFTLGIIEGSAEDAMDMSIYEPKSVKQYVVKHFEKSPPLSTKRRFMPSPA